MQLPMGPATIDTLHLLEDTILDNKVALAKGEYSGGALLFRDATLLDGSRGGSVLVRLYPDGSPSDSVLDRHREAMFLTHPNLLKCLAAGSTVVQDQTFVYAIYEAPDYFLSEVLNDRALTETETRTLATELTEGLGYLHGRGIVYCNLNNSTVARQDETWKLCDYSQLRVAGSGLEENETRRLQAMYPGSPPEAFDGHANAALDTWGLAHLTRSALSGEYAAVPKDAPSLPGRPDDTSERLESWEPPARVPTSSRYPIVPQILVVSTAAALGFFGMILYQKEQKPAPAAEIIAVEQRPQPTHIPAPVVPQPARDTGDRGRTENSQVSEKVREWEASFRARNLVAQMELYAPRLERFYLKSNVPKAFVRKVKEDTLKRVGKIQRYEVTNMQTQYENAARATVTFDKSWQFSRKPQDSGKVRGELKLQKQNGDWRIVSERDLVVYRMRRI